MTKAKDLRTMSKADLDSRLVELRKELIKHNAQIATGTTPKSPGQVREVKKTIAKILTIVSGAKKAPSTKVREPEEAEKPSETKKAEEKEKAPAKKSEEE